MSSKLGGKIYNKSNRRLCDICIKKCLTVQAEVRLLAAAATPPGGPGWEAHVQLSGNLCSQSFLLPSSFLSSIPNRRLSSILLFLFLPYTQHGSQTKLFLSSPLCLVSLPSPGWQLRGGNDEEEGWVVCRSTAPQVGAAAHVEDTWTCKCEQLATFQMHRRRDPEIYIQFLQAPLPDHTFWGEILRITK